MHQGSSSGPYGLGDDDNTPDDEGQYTSDLQSQGHNPDEGKNFLCSQFAQENHRNGRIPELPIDKVSPDEDEQVAEMAFRSE